jgi:hypothetical protein
LLATCQRYVFKQTMLCHTIYCEQAASTWQELEAAVYQKQGLLALLQQQQPEQEQQQEQSTAAYAAVLQPTTPDLQQQQQQPPRKQRRKQPVPVLSVPTSSLLSGLPTAPDSPPAAAAAAAAAAAPRSPASLSSSSSSAAAAGTGAPVKPAQQHRQQQAPDNPQPSQQQQQLPLSALHVTEAFRKLPDLLTKHRISLQPPDRQRVSDLISYLSAAALQHAQDLTLDARGVAHVLLGLSKLGHRDGLLFEELQLALLLNIQGLSSRHAAMVLMAFAGLSTW